MPFLKSDIYSKDKPIYIIKKDHSILWMFLVIFIGFVSYLVFFKEFSFILAIPFFIFFVIISYLTVFQISFFEKKIILTRLFFKTRKIYLEDELEKVVIVNNIMTKYKTRIDVYYKWNGIVLNKKVFLYKEDPVLLYDMFSKNCRYKIEKSIIPR